ncbi:cobalamin B12-binding domain-containing protein [Algihabitans albus]|uniref:cobalamin B12-binding domain-containing protein n=1 Tax=Algihabitans albus TaxID=2164067 RepID=UPI0013C2CB6B|nr:cobalamin B12-binding domain-containing protein [Algihabitans albus]
MRGSSETPLSDFEESQKRARLARTIEGEIIPRLKLAHGTSESGQAENGMPVVLDMHRVPNASDIEAFAKLVISQDVGVALAHLELLRAHGTSLDCLFLDLLAPCAQFLGDLWLADECSFIDVTIGLARLQQILRELSPDFEAENTDEAHPGRRILLMPAPGEQHAFGLSLVEHFLRRAGWEVTVASADNRSVSKLLRKEWFTVVGFSMSRVGLLDGLQSCIRSLRQVSRNPGISFLVGGNAFNERPDLVSRAGADGMAGDGCLAVLEADRLSAPPCVSAAAAPTRKNRKHDGAAGLARQRRSV